jgi:hypothetical protein
MRNMYILTLRAASGHFLSGIVILSSSVFTAKMKQHYHRKNIWIPKLEGPKIHLYFSETLRLIDS